MSILEKLNIEELSDTKLRDEILRTEEQIKILELTEKEYNGYLQLLKAEREKREIKEPDYLHRHMRAIRIIDEFTYIFFEIDGTLYYDCFLQRKKVEHKKYGNLNEFREFNISHGYTFEEITIKKTATGLEFVKEGW